MTALSTGSGQFPTSAQLAIGIGATVVRKSVAATSTARNWTLIADDTCFYLFTESGDLTSPFAALPFMFGDFFSYCSTDSWKCAMIGRNQENAFTYPTAGEPFYAVLFCFNNLLSTTQSGCFIAAGYTGVGGSIVNGKHIDFSACGYNNSQYAPGQGGVSGTGSYTCGQNSSTQAMGCNYAYPAAFPYPNAPDGGLFLSPVYLHHNGFKRGYYKGIWAPEHHLPLNHNDTYNGTGLNVGKTYLSQMLPANLSNASNPTGNGQSQVHIETSSTWS
jgi:hypothetical protein